MDLSPQQQAAVEGIEPRIALIACPGSGKTRTLTKRVVHMIEENGVAPSSIVLLTFTRFAAGVMRDRLGPWGNQLGYCGTFHAFCLSIVQEFGHKIGWEPEWLTIMDEEEARLDELDILKDLRLINRSGTWLKCKSSEWAKIRDDILNGDYDRDGEHNRSERLLTVAWDTFSDRLRSENCLTFGTLVTEAHSLLANDEINNKVRSVYKHMLVDECQDSSNQEWLLMERLNPDSLFCVGDPDQSIYEFRGGRPELFLEYADKATCYNLTQSYRFGFNIAEPMNSLIKHNQNRIDIAIEAISSNAGTLNVMHDASYQDIGSIIKDEVKSGVDPKDMAVLARKHVTLDGVASELSFQKIPYTQIGGPSHVTQTAEFRVIKGYLRLAVNDQDRRAFMAVATSEGISTEKLWELREKALTDDVSIYQAYVEEGLFAFPNTVPELRDYLIKKESMTNYGPSFDFLEELQRAQGLYDNGEMIRYLQMMSMQDLIKKEVDDTTLMTVHASKGTEHDNVFVVGLNQDEFPSKRSIREGNEESERRLLYVAATRARKKLWLIQNAPSDPGKERLPSSFFNEIGAYEKMRTPESIARDNDQLPM